MAPPPPCASDADADSDRRLRCCVPLLRAANATLPDVADAAVGVRLGRESACMEPLMSRALRRLRESLLLPATDLLGLIAVFRCVCMCMCVCVCVCVCVCAGVFRCVCVCVHVCFRDSFSSFLPTLFPHSFSQDANSSPSPLPHSATNVLGARRAVKSLRCVSAALCATPQRRGAPTQTESHVPTVASRWTLEAWRL